MLGDNERLQRKLLEVELDAQSVEKQASALADTILLLREVGVVLN